MNIFGKLIKIDFIKSEITLRLAFLDESTIEFLNTLLDFNKMTKLSLKSSILKEEINDNARRRWFAILSTILKFHDIPPIGDYLLSFHYEMKDHFFNVKKFTIGDSFISVVPSINSVSIEEIHKACNILIERYSKLGIKFENY